MDRKIKIAMLTLLLAAAPRALATVTDLEVDPSPPGCADEITLSVEGYFQDLCWRVNGIEHIVDGNVYRFVIHAIDYVDQVESCGLALLEYSAQETIARPPDGDYWLVVSEDVVSPRYSGDTASIPFTVCCEPAPGPVSGLSVSKLPGGPHLRFTWTDVAGATDYALYEDDEADGAFVENVGSATTGATGIDYAPPAGTAGVPRFFLVTARNGCAEGPKRNEEEP